MDKAVLFNSFSNKSMGQTDEISRGNLSFKVEPKCWGVD